MIKTLQNTLKQDRERYSVPKSVQDTIPIRRLWQDGVFQFGSKYSKTLRFSDINYAIASKEDKTAMFLRYSELLNALDTGSTTKITINNKRLNRRNFEEEILIPTRGDYLDGGRAEYNAMLLDKVTDSTNSVVQERYITVSAHKKNIEEARTFFSRTVNDITSRLSHMDSHCEELDAVERLRVLHDFYRVGEEMQFQLDLRACMKSGRSCKDAVCPDSMEFKKDHFVMGEKFGRVLFLKEYASYIKDSMIQELTSLDRSLMLSIDIIPVPTDEAVREMQNRLLGVETNVTNWQRRQNNNNNFSAVVPYDLEQQRKETREMLDDLTTRDQRMMFAVVTLVHLADSKEELDSDTETFQSMVRKHLCQLTTLNWQQAEGLVTALPLGVRRIDALRTLTTEALAVLMPFKAQEIRDRGGVYYGQNVISKNLIVADRRQLLNGNGFVLGVSGSGKSFTAKREMVALALSTEDDILVIDPEAEYRPLIEGLGGQVINISATSPNHINAMDMEQGYGDGENPVVLKSEFLLSLCEQLIGAGKLSAKEKSIIDRCTAQVYHDYIRGGYQGETPTLQDFHAELLRQPEGEARDVALAILVLICLFGVLAASPFGIVYASEDEKADLTLPSAIATLNAEFSERVEQCKEDYTGQYDRVQVDASAIPNWTDILAVYTVKTSMDKEDPVEVATMDQKKLVLLRKICEEMTPLSATLRSEGEKTVLVIQLQPKTYRQMADEYHFDQEQRKMLEELIDSGLLDLFLEANEPTEEDGPIQPGSGGYAWPLPGYTRISSPFAYRNCPYHGRELHGGIDLPAPRGTSILAAKAGVVAKSTYNASYGNYVVLRHPDGTQTLYAHMSARTVTAGQTVHQGMVIGKVGSTGNSTGNHLHFETWTSSSSGSRVNPMQYF